jgi:subtilisin-like proprotein convertase family protein
VSDGQFQASSSFLLTVGTLFTATNSFTNGTTITIPDSGAAAPYPSIINVSGIVGTVSNVTLTLRNITHTWPDDIDIVLVGPGGQKVMVLSDAGGGNGLNNVTITLSDAAAALAPDTAAIVSGTYKPTDYVPGDVLAAPAPAGPYATTLSTFNGQSPNGSWSLYVFDDGPGDQGNIAGGWSLTLTTVSTTGAPPTISAIPNQATSANTATGPIPFTVGDADTPLDSLTFSPASSNLTLVPLGNIVVAGSGANRTVTVTPASGQTGTSLITLTVSDGVNNANSSFLLTVNGQFVGTRSFTNATAITIPLLGAATPYPSTINVAGLGGTISSLTLTLRGITHTWPDDLDVLLVGPAGQKVLVLSDVGGGNGLNSVTITLSDAAAAALPDTGAIVSGTYKPTDFDPTSDTFAAPAPAGPYASTLSAFNGQSPNGTWSLYVFDDGAGDQGSMAGWNLTITTSGTASLPAPNDLAPVLLISRAGTIVTLTFDTVTGKTYVIEQNDLVQGSVWTRVDSVSGSGDTVTFPEAISGASARFYRVRVE